MLNSLKIFNVYVGRKTCALQIWKERLVAVVPRFHRPAVASVRCIMELWIHVKDRKLVAALHRWLKSIDAVAGWSVEAKMSLDLVKLKSQQPARVVGPGFTIASCCSLWMRRWRWNCTGVVQNFHHPCAPVHLCTAGAFALAPMGSPERCGRCIPKQEYCICAGE